MKHCPACQKVVPDDAKTCPHSGCGKSLPHDPGVVRVAPPPPPGSRLAPAIAPPDVPALDKQDQTAVANLTVRQRTELHRTNPVCANCHQILDPIGFGLEKFDAIGRWRDRDSNGQPIDAAGELPGPKRFSGPADLKAIIAGRNGDVARNLVEKLLAYALGRKLEGYDEIVVDDLMGEIAGDEYRMRALINGVITSYPFTHRRIGEQRRLNEQN